MPMKVRYTTINGEVIAENRNGVRKQYVPDPLGSTVALLDDTQAITDTFSYWPYGEVQTRTGSTETAMQFVGTLGYFGGNDAAIYVRQRSLAVQIGSWMAEDPMGFYGGDFNVYRYSSSSPTTLSDPSGLFSLCCNRFIKLCCPKPKPNYGPIARAYCGKLRADPNLDECATVCDDIVNGQCVNVADLILCISQIRSCASPPFPVPDPGMPKGFPNFLYIETIGAAVWCQQSGLCCGITPILQPIPPSIH